MENISQTLRTINFVIKYFIGNVQKIAHNSAHYQCFCIEWSAQIILLLSLSVINMYAVAMDSKNETVTDTEQTFDGYQIIVEGEIIEKSQVPESVTDDYPDALFSTQIRVSGSNTPLESEVVSVYFNAFLNRVSQPETKLNKGDKVHLKLIPWEKTSEDIQQWKVLDDIYDIDNPCYYCLNHSAIEEYSQDLIRSFQIVQSSTNDEITYNIRSEEEILARKKQIQQDLDTVEQLISKHGGFSLWEKEIEPITEFFKKEENQDQTKEINGITFKLWPTLFRLYGFTSSTSQVKALSGCLALKEYLDERGIDLIVVLLPFAIELEFDLFYPDQYQGDSIFDLYRIEILKEFLEHDIEVVDIYQKMIAERMIHPFFQQKTMDWHQSCYTNMVLAKELAKRLSRYKTYNDPIDLNDFVLEKRIVNQEDSYVFRNTKASDRFYFHDESSPFLLTGDSFSYSPTEETSIAAFLTKETRIMPAEIFRTGSSGTRKLADIAKLKPSFWNSRKALILVVSPLSYKYEWIKKDFKTMSAFRKGTAVFSRSGHSMLNGAMFKTLSYSTNMSIPMTYSIGASDKGISFTSPGPRTEVAHQIEYDTGIEYNKEKDYIAEIVISGDDIHFGDIYVTLPDGKTQVQNAHGIQEKLYYRFSGKDVKTSRMLLRFILPENCFLSSIIIHEISKEENSSDNGIQ